MKSQHTIENFWDELWGREVKIFVLLALVMAFLVGCGGASYGSRQDAAANISKPEIRDQVVEGVSTKEEVRRAFGEPAMVNTSTDFEIWTYSLREVPQQFKGRSPILHGIAGYNMGGLPMTYNTLTITFRNGVVSRKSFTTFNAVEP